jgi:hypothetical protein
MKTKKLFLMMIAAAMMMFAGCDSKNEAADDDEQVDGNDDQVGGYIAAPPHAASSKTWKFGNHTWSDVIQIPECNKETYEASYTTPQCYCNSSVSSISGYLYNWVYVNSNAATLCPSPWRVPTAQDLSELVKNVTYGELCECWHLSPTAYRVGLVWSSTSEGGYAQYLQVYTYGGSQKLQTPGAEKKEFLRVACVR